MNPIQRCRRVRALPEKYDSLHDVVIVDHHAVRSVNRLPYLTQTNLRTLRDHANVFDTKCRSVLRLDYGLLDIHHVSDQSHGTHIDLLRSLLDKTPARIRVGVGKLLFQLRQTQAVGDQFVGIYSNLIFARDTTERRIVHDIRHGFDVLADDPVLNRFQFHHVVSGVLAFERVPVDRANRTEIRADACADIGRQRDLCEMLEYLLAVPVVVGIVIENQIHHRQSRQGSGTHMLKVRHAVHLNFDGHGNLLLHFFCSSARPLGDYLNPRVRNFRVCLNRQSLERDRSPDEQKQHEAQDNEAIVEREIDELANHHCSAVFWNSSAFSTTRWPGATPETISCIPPGSISPALTSTRRNWLSFSGT